MSHKWEFVFFVFFIFFTRISTTIADTESKEETSKIISAESGANLTLPCHPSLQNTIQDVLDFEWVTDNEIPVFSKGRLSLHLNLNSVHEAFAVKNSSLIINKIEAGNFTYTCHLPRLNKSYTYFLQVKKSEDSASSKRWHLNKPIKFSTEGETVILPCVADADIGSSTANTNYAWIAKKDDVESAEIISVNQRIILPNNVAGFQIDQNRSLIIPNFSPKLFTNYECHLSTGSSIAHYSYPKSDNGDKVTWIKKKIAVARGFDVTLNCSGATSPDFVWIFEDDKILSVGGNVPIDGPNSDGRLLTIKNFTSSKNGVYKCISSSGINYEYTVTEQKPIRETLFVAIGGNITLPCDETQFLWTQYIKDKKKILFINGNPVPGSKIDNVKIADDRRSLVITNFSYKLWGTYICRTIFGVEYEYAITIPSILSSGDLGFSEKTLSVTYGTRNTILNCPPKYRNDNASLEWIFESSLGSKGQASLLFVNRERFDQYWSDYYEIDDDGSLIISLMNLAQYGKYLCRWSTGEQYVYDIPREIHWRNRTIWASERRSIQLPCPMEVPADRELNVINWAILKPKAEYFGDFKFLNGKIFPPVLRQRFPDDVKLSGDKQALIISNITSSSEGDYYCNLIRSNIVYYYSVKVKDICQETGYCS